MLMQRFSRCGLMQQFCGCQLHLWMRVVQSRNRCFSNRRITDCTAQRRQEFEDRQRIRLARQQRGSASTNEPVGLKKPRPMHRRKLFDR